jgi:hypothetical protein
MAGNKRAACAAVLQLVAVTALVAPSAAQSNVPAYVEQHFKFLRSFL